MSKSSQKLRALSLRRRGISIKDIAKSLDVSRSSVSVWCQGIVLSATQREKLFEKQIVAGNVGRQKGAEANRQKRITALNEASARANRQINSISKNELYFLGLGIYWGEGIKSRSGPAAIVNSDSYILKVSKRWFIECMEVNIIDFRPYVYISREHLAREEIIMSYWVNQLDIPRAQFKSPIYIAQKARQKYENHDSYYGVVALRVQKSTHLKYRILALLKTVAERLE